MKYFQINDVNWPYYVIFILPTNLMMRDEREMNVRDDDRGDDTRDERERNVRDCLFKLMASGCHIMSFSSYQQNSMRERERVMLSLSPFRQ